MYSNPNKDNTDPLKNVYLEPAYRFEWRSLVSSYTPGGPGLGAEPRFIGNITNRSDSIAVKIPSDCRSLYVNVHYVVDET